MDNEKEFNEVLSSILHYGFLTGSRAFGTPNKDSDWDIAVPFQVIEPVKRALSAYSCTDSNYFSGSTYVVGLWKINVIPLHPNEYLPWYLATKAVAATLVLSGIDDKVKKHAVFMGIVSLYKATVEQSHNRGDFHRIETRIWKDIRGE